jgi:hypothetical protein
MKKRAPLASYLLPRVQDIIFIFFFYLVLVLGTNLFRDGDPGRHITFGRYILSTLTIPQTDIYAYTTQGVTLPSYEWLAQASYAIGYNLLGLSGVVLVVGFVLATTLALVYNEMIRREIPNIIAFAFTFWVALLTMVHWLARPHIFSLLYLILLTPRLARLAKGEKVPLWQFPLIMLFWANTHAAFALAFAIWFAFIAGNIWETLRTHSKINNPILQKLIFTATLSFLATLINPSGWGLWQFITGFMGNRYLIEIAGETRSVNFHNPVGWMVLITLALIIFITSRSTQKRPMAESFLIIGWMMIGLYGIRNIPQFAVVSIPLVAEHAKNFLEDVPFLKKLGQNIASLEAQLRGRIWSIATCIIFIVLLASGIKLDAAKQGYHFNDVEYPVEAVNWLAENPQPGHMFNYFPWGGYLIYRLWPEYKVFLDGQMIYIEPLVRDYEKIINATPGWEETLTQYNIQWVLVPDNEQVVQALLQDPGWQILYEDSTAVIFARK